mgnify:CR=1 FL=1
MFRKGGLIAAAVLALLLFFLHDYAAKLVIVSAGEAVFKAKVSVKKADLKLLKSVLLIEGMVVADKNNEFRNLFEAEKIYIGLNMTDILRGKFVTEKVEITGVSAGTQRRNSGFLPPSRVKKIKEEEKRSGGFTAGLGESLKKKAVEEAGTIPVLKAAEIAEAVKKADFKALIEPDKMAVKRKAGELAAGADEKREKILKKAESINGAERAAQIRKRAEELSSVRVSSAADIPQAQKALSELDEALKDAEALKKDAAGIKKDAEDFYGYSRSIKGEIDKAVEEDTKLLMEKTGLNFISASSLEEALIGPIWLGRINSAMDILKMADKYVPGGKKKEQRKPAAVQRGKGREILYSGSARPKFWVKKADVSGSGEKYKIAGALNDLAFEQAITGKPSKARIKYDKAGSFYTIDAVIDRVESVNDSVLVAIKNLDAKDAGVSSIDYGKFVLEGAIIDADIKAYNTSEKARVSAEINLKNMVFKKKTGEEDLIFDIVNKIGAVKIRVNAEIKDGRASVSAGSDAVSAISRGLGKIYGEKAAEIEAAARRSVMNAAGPDISGVIGGSEKSAGDIRAVIAGVDGAAGSAVSDIEKAKKKISAEIDRVKKEQGGSLLKGIMQ